MAAHVPQLGTREVYADHSPINHGQDSPMNVLEHGLPLLRVLLEQITQGDSLRRLQRRGRCHTSHYTGPSPRWTGSCPRPPSHLEVSVLWTTELEEQLGALQSCGIVIVGRLQHICCFLVPDQTADLAVEGLDDRVAL